MSEANVRSFEKTRYERSECAQEGSQNSPVTVLV